MTDEVMSKRVADWGNELLVHERSIRERIAKAIEATIGSQCGGWEPPEKRADLGYRYHPHYPDEGWAFCDGCSMAQEADATAHRCAEIARAEVL